MDYAERDSILRLNEILPRILPARWVPIEGPVYGQLAFVNRTERLTVICTAAPYQDKRWWLHFSISHPTRIPTWDELVRAKELFIGVERKAVQVFAPRSEWVNQHPHCLHLFCCLSEDPLPDFTEGSNSL